MSHVVFLPPDISDTASAAEKKLFRALAGIGFDAMVFHSFGLAEHRHKAYGEIDFILLSEYGVMCLEVKGGGVSCDTRGIWHHTDRFGNEHTARESPFRQATANLFSLRDYLHSCLPADSPLRDVPFGCAVAFPDVSFTQTVAEFPPGLIYDNRTSDLTGFLIAASRYWSDKQSASRVVTCTGLDPAGIRQLATLLRSDFHVLLRLSDIVRDTETQLSRLTDEQAYFMDAISLNDHILVSGGAGTGKTVLGIEFAKREAVQGSRVLFLTFNKNLAARLKRDCRDIHDATGRLDVEHFHGLLVRILGDRKPPEDETDIYYTEVLPGQFCSLAASGEIEVPAYDLLVIDEGQDLVRQEYCACLERLLRGGLDRGRWCIFMDPNQNLYNREAFADGFETLLALQPARFELVVNCRNTRQIATFNQVTTSIPAARLLKAEGVDVTIVSYRDDRELGAKLADTVKSLRKEGVKPGDITLLTRHRYENTPLPALDPFRSICGIQQVTDTSINLLSEDKIHVCTIHSFKGLDARIVFLVGLGAKVDDVSRPLYYTGISRARSALFVFRKA